MKGRRLLFAAPLQVIIEEFPVPPPPPGHLLVRTAVSAISPGTEMLVYRGELPRDLALDATIPALAQAPTYPLTYGYAAAGQVMAVGAQADEGWLGRWVFAFTPHASHFIVPVSAALPLPQDVSPEQAVFLPNMESAVNFLMDGAPQLGEEAVVFGQGVVGLLTTALLARFPLRTLVGVDAIPGRRARGQTLGAHQSLDPTAPEWPASVAAALIGEGADLVFELSGNPLALDQAIQVAGFGARLIVGSWYGSKPVTLNLGGPFHRKRLRLLSSQVSTVDPRHSGRWDKERRLSLAWHHLTTVPVSSLVTHRIPLDDGAEAYRLIHRQSHETLQVILTYPA